MSAPLQESISILCMWTYRMCVCVIKLCVSILIEPMSSSIHVVYNIIVYIYSSLLYINNVLSGAIRGYRNIVTMYSLVHVLVTSIRHVQPTTGVSVLCMYVYTYAFYLLNIHSFIIWIYHLNSPLDELKFVTLKSV